jgi:hypothetical protein
LDASARDGAQPELLHQAVLERRVSTLDPAFRRSRRALELSLAHGQVRRPAPDTPAPAPEPALDSTNATPDQWIGKTSASQRCPPRRSASEWLRFDDGQGDMVDHAGRFHGSVGAPERSPNAAPRRAKDSGVPIKLGA